MEPTHHHCLQARASPERPALGLDWGARDGGALDTRACLDSPSPISFHTSLESSACSEPLAFGAAREPYEALPGDDLSSCDRRVPTHFYEEEVEDEEEPPETCLNCTAPLWCCETVCPDCGHQVADGATLLDPGLLRGALPPALARRPRRDRVTAVSYDDDMLLHDESAAGCRSAGAGPHPERPDRLRAVWARLQAAELAGRCERLPSRPATDAELELVHTRAHVAGVQALCDGLALRGGDDGDGHDDRTAASCAAGASPPATVPSDTYVCAATARAARLGAGAAIDVACAVARGDADAGIAVVRPPGHHAESNVAQGFCFFNNAAAAARAAQRRCGVGRVLVLDWDVHHGNGTQEIFHDDGSVLYISLHRHEGGTFYPGTGSPSDVGVGAGRGTSLNIGWPCGGLTDADYMAAFTSVVLPVALEFAPDFVVLSAGFDAAAGDPIGGCLLTPGVFAAMTSALAAAVAPCVAVLEGGYNLGAVAACTEACVRAMLGERVAPAPAAPAVPGVAGLDLEAEPYALPASTLPAPGRACAAAWDAVRATARAHAPYWACMASLAAALERHDADALPGAAFGGLRPVASCPSAAFPTTPTGPGLDRGLDARRRKSLPSAWPADGGAAGRDVDAPSPRGSPVSSGSPGSRAALPARPITPAISPRLAQLGPSVADEHDDASPPSSKRLMLHHDGPSPSWIPVHFT